MIENFSVLKKAEEPLRTWCEAILFFVKNTLRLSSFALLQGSVAAWNLMTWKLFQESIDKPS